MRKQVVLNKSVQLWVLKQELQAIYLNLSHPAFNALQELWKRVLNLHHKNVWAWRKRSDNWAEEGEQWLHSTSFEAIAKDNQNLCAHSD